MMNALARIPLPKVKSCWLTLSKCFDSKQGIQAFRSALSVWIFYHEGCSCFRFPSHTKWNWCQTAGLLVQLSWVYSPSHFYGPKVLTGLHASSTWNTTRAQWWRGKLLPKSEMIRISSVHFSKANSVPRLFKMDCCQSFRNIYSVLHVYYAIGHECY